MKKSILALTLLLSSMSLNAQEQNPTYVLLNGTVGVQPSITYTADMSLYAAAYQQGGGFIYGRAYASYVLIQDGTDRLMKAMEALKQNNPTLFAQVMAQYQLQFNEPTK